MSHISGDSNSQKTWEFLKFVCFFEVFWKFESFSLRIGRFLGLQTSPRPIWPQRSGSDLFRICGCVFWCFVGKKIGCGKSPTGAIGILPKKEVLISKHQPCLNDWWMICLTHTHTQSSIPKFQMTHRLEVKLDRAAETFHVCEKMQTETISEKIGEARVLN